MAGKQFISVKKAATVTGKPERKIVKWCEKHRDTKYIRFEDGLYRIRLDFLVEHFNTLKEEPEALAEPEPDFMPVPEPITKAPPAVDTVQAENKSLVTVLKEQLVEKDRQLTAKDAHITQLIERNREQNNIIFSLEQHKQSLEAKLNMPAPKREPKKLTVEKQAASVTKPVTINYALLAVTIILSGVLLIIFYTLLTS